MNNIAYYTAEGLAKLNDEINHLINVERIKISAQIAEARDKGDLSENAEYDAAKEAQGLLERRISEMQTTISNARILDESKIDASKVLLMSTVKMKDVKTNMEMKKTIVPASEANMKEGKISVSSPVAKGLLGKKVGDIAEIVVPAGVLNFEILEISR